MDRIRYPCVFYGFFEFLIHKHIQLIAMDILSIGEDCPGGPVKEIRKAWQLACY